MSLVGAHLQVFGSVQGVGFRYFCIKKARPGNITGWVRNRPDGSVELMVEGERRTVEQYVAELRQGPPYAQVSEVAVEWSPPTNRFKTFEVTG